MRDAGSPTPERELFRRVAEGDASARDELIERHIGLAQRLASRYRNSGEPLDDLRQVAMVGLINSVDRYNPEAGPFIRYAVPNILGELKRHFRDKSWGVHVPRSLQERSLKVGNAVEALSSRLGHTPVPREVAEATGMTLEEVLEAMDVSSAYTPGALDAPLPGDDGGQRTVVDTLGDEDERYELVELRQSVAPAFRDLPQREQVILKLRFMDDKTQAEIASEIGVSQMHVSRLLRRSLHQLSETVDGAPPSVEEDGGS